MNRIFAATPPEAVRAFKPKNAKELARRVGPDKLYAIDGVGPMTIYVFMCALDHLGADSEVWFNHNVKLSTLYAQVKGEKKKRSGKRGSA